MINTKKEVIEILNELGFEAQDDIEDQVTIQKEMGLDSLDFVELIIACEKEFVIHITDDEALDIDTVGDLVKCIDKLKTL